MLLIFLSCICHFLSNNGYKVHFFPPMVVIRETQTDKDTKTSEREIGEPVALGFDDAPHPLIHCKFHRAFETPGHMTAGGPSLIDGNIMSSKAHRGMVLISQKCRRSESVAATNDYCHYQLICRLLLLLSDKSLNCFFKLSKTTETHSKHNYGSRGNCSLFTFVWKSIDDFSVIYYWNNLMSIN